MLYLFKKDPLKKLETRRKVLLEEAMHLQRSGDLRLYADKIIAISNLEREIQGLSDTSTNGPGTNNH